MQLQALLREQAGRAACPVLLGPVAGPTAGQEHGAVALGQGQA